VPLGEPAGTSWWACGVLFDERVRCGALYCGGHVARSRSTGRSVRLPDSCPSVALAHRQVPAERSLDR